MLVVALDTIEINFSLIYSYAFMNQIVNLRVYADAKALYRQARPSSNTITIIIP